MGKALSIKEKNAYKRGFEALLAYAEKNGLEVQCGAGYVDEIHDGDSLVRINTRYRIDEQVFGLAHELGHFLIRRNTDNFAKKYPLRARKANRQIKRTKAYLYQEIKEEIEAWKRGRDLLDRLGIIYDKEQFEKSESLSVFSYISYAAAEK